VPLGALAAVIAALVRATLGAQLVTGQMPGPLGIGDGGLSTAAAVFIAGSAVVCLMAWIGSLVVASLRRAT
jgi:hypothetical protein